MSIIAARNGPPQFARYSAEVVAPVEGLKQRRTERKREWRRRIATTKPPEVLAEIEAALRAEGVVVRARMSRCRQNTDPGRYVRRFVVRRVGWWSATFSLEAPLDPSAGGDVWTAKRRLRAHFERVRERFADRLVPLEVEPC